MAPAKKVVPPIRTAMIDPKTGLVTQQWALFFETLAARVNELAEA